MTWKAHSSAGTTSGCIRDFRAWNIEAELPLIKAPILALQGEDDQYGTLYQIEEIQRRNARTRLFKIPDCKHSPHRDQPDVVISAVQSFLATLPEIRREAAS